ncbi:Aste57867_14031 [Aphanomyces stellatus]|uniref:Aste57867_14031 protein n=1 Tax=Aphanomyces stellatus TaxID=120398 RepID=A0A485L0G8_9STRA|nr:hypothetical protein As57867_013980 [Aphanomyces stellatus]VFT90861.1 Aste57867_14031 [Aphanomyces stellatus]
MDDARACTRTAIILSVSFLLIFTSYNGIENLETSIIRGECHNCLSGLLDGICQSGTTCQAKVKFSCDEACVAPFHECKSLLGSTILGVIYLAFMLNAFLGPLLPNYFGTKRSMVGGSVSYAIFAFANLAVSWTPGSLNFHWGLMIPVALLLGISASVMWIAQASYLTQVSVVYSKFKQESIVSSMGMFNGIFFAIYKASRVTGNLISSLVLGYLGWPTTTLFTIYSCLGLTGTALLCVLPSLPHHAASPSRLSSSLMATPDAQPPAARSGVSFRALWALATDTRMLALAPVFVLNGLQQGFATSEFTSNFIRESLGSASIGYVMAVFGVVNVLASYTFGKLADKFDPLIGHAVGYGSLLTAYALCYALPVSKCDDKWVLVVAIAVLLSLGDAASTTLAKVVLGQEFPMDSVHAFSVFTVYQSGTVSASFFLLHYLRYVHHCHRHLFGKWMWYPSSTYYYCSFHGRLAVLITMTLVASAAYILYTKRFRRVVKDMPMSIQDELFGE